MADCSTTDITLNHYILPTLNALTATATIPLIYLYIKAYTRQQLKSSNNLFKLGLVFFVLVFIWFIENSIKHIVHCTKYRNDYSNYLIMSNSVLYLIQSSLLIIILFIRLIHIFDGTALAISKCTIYSFAVLVIITVISVLTCAVLWQLLKQFHPKSPLFPYINIIWSFFFVVYLVVLIWLNGIFVFKMHKVFHAEEKEEAINGEVMNTITKATVLCAVSSLTVVLHLGLWYDVNNIIHFVVLGDLCTNFLSIWLSYGCFYEYYAKVCCCCDKLFKICIGGRIKAEILQAEMATNIH